MADTVADNTVYFSNPDQVVGDDDLGDSLCSGFEVAKLLTRLAFEQSREPYPRRTASDDALGCP